MDDEDDYDDFGDELENDLASDGEADGMNVLSIQMCNMQDADFAGRPCPR